MSTLPVGDLTTHGYEPPRNVQFSVFLDNRVGKLLELVEIFHGQALKLAGFSILDSAEYAVIRILTSRSDLARRLLERHQFPFSEADVLVVEIDDDHSLDLACKALLAAELSIRYAYPLLVRPRGRPTVALQTDDLHLGCALLRKRLFTLLAENDLGDNALLGGGEGLPPL
ncbi:MAG: hypothetical protein WD768_04805 [Phycisphaeraceae bacterium]